MLINSRLDFRIIFGLVKEIQLQSNVESYHINMKAAIFRVLSQLTYSDCKQTFTETLQVLTLLKSSRSEVFCKTNLKNLRENTCARISFLIKLQDFRPATLLKKEALAQLFSCEFCEVFKNTFSQNSSEGVPLIVQSLV